MDERVKRLSVRFKAEDIGGHKIIVYITNDLNEFELQYHYEKAVLKQDYDYMQAVVSEAKSRNIKLNDDVWKI